jgi:acetyl-CoA carboxylase biotin carboxyl carrier protein
MEKGTAMTNQEIYDLIACFERSSLQTLRLSRQDFSIELSRGGAAAAAPAAPAAMPAPAAAPAPREADGEAITAPLVGTFYTAPAPDQPPFVKVGDRVKKGQTVCLIEAMKMMSEVPAPCDCIIEAVLKDNGELAAFGEPLLRYKPC